MTTEDVEPEDELTTIAGLTSLIEKWDERIRVCAVRAARQTDPVKQRMRMRELVELTSQRDAAARALDVALGHGGVAPR